MSLEGKKVENYFGEKYDFNTHIRVCLYAHIVKTYGLPKADTLRLDKVHNYDLVAGLHKDWSRKRLGQCEYNKLFNRPELKSFFLKENLTLFHYSDDPQVPTLSQKWGGGRRGQRIIGRERNRNYRTAQGKDQEEQESVGGASDSNLSQHTEEVGSYDESNWFDFYASRNDSNMPRRPPKGKRYQQQHEQQYNYDQHYQYASTGLPHHRRRKSNAGIRDLSSESEQASSICEHMNKCNLKSRSRETLNYNTDTSGDWKSKKVKSRVQPGSKSPHSRHHKQETTDSGLVSSCDPEVRKRVGEWRRRNLEKTYYDNNDDYDRKGRDYCGERGDPQDSSDSDGYASDYSVYKNDGLSKTDPTHVPREGSYFEHDDRSFRRYKYRMKYRSRSPKVYHKEQHSANVPDSHRYPSRRMTPSTHHPPTSGHYRRGYPYYPPDERIAHYKETLNRNYKPHPPNPQGTIMRKKIPKRYQKGYDNNEIWKHDKFQGYESISSDSLGESSEGESGAYEGENRRGGRWRMRRRRREPYPEKRFDRYEHGRYPKSHHDHNYNHRHYHPYQSYSSRYPSRYNYYPYYYHYHNPHHPFHISPPPFPPLPGNPRGGNYPRYPRPGPPGVRDDAEYGTRGGDGGRGGRAWIQQNHHISHKVFQYRYRWQDLRQKLSRRRMKPGGYH